MWITSTGLHLQENKANVFSIRGIKCWKLFFFKVYQICKPLDVIHTVIKKIRYLLKHVYLLKITFRVRRSITWSMGYHSVAYRNHFCDQYFQKNLIIFPLPHSYFYSISIELDLPTKCQQSINFKVSEDCSSSSPQKKTRFWYWRMCPVLTFLSHILTTDDFFF